MSTNIQDLIKAKTLPPWMLKHNAFKNIKNVSKVFPGIGLANCTEETSIDNPAALKDIADPLLCKIVENISNANYYLSNYSPFAIPKYSATINKIHHWGKVCGSLFLIIHKCVTTKNNKISFNLPEAILNPEDCTLLYKEGEGLFKVYNKLRKSISSLRCGITLPNLEKSVEFKDFSSNNIPFNNIKIQFSSDGVDGLWDIITMSMRGIRSCQSWKGQYKLNLIGSVVDPCVAIIYLTSGTNFNEYGSKMIKRCIVKFCLDSSTNKPCLLVDKMYPSYNEAMFKIFSDFLKQKTNNQFDVIYGFNLHSDLLGKLYVPESKQIKNLPDTVRSYRDTKITIGKNNQGIKLYKNNVIIKTSNFLVNAGKIFSNSVYTIRKNHSRNSNIGFIAWSSDFHYILNDLGREVARKACDSINSDDFSSSSLFMKKVYFNMIATKSSIIKKSERRFANIINRYFGGKKIMPREVREILRPAIQQLDLFAKEELKKIILRKSNVVKLPG